MNEVDRCANVIDFWHLLEFLDQDDFMSPSWDEKAACRAARNAKSPRKAYPISLYHGGTIEEFDLQRCVENDAQAYPLHGIVSDSACLCACSFERDDAFNALKKRLIDEFDERPDKPSRGRVACFALKTDLSGHYIPGSVRISPILWALDRSCERGSEFVHAVSVQECDEFTRRFESELIHGRECVLVNPIFLNETFQLLSKRIRGMGEIRCDRRISFKYARTGREDDELLVDGNDLSKSYILHDLAFAKSALLSSMTMPAYVRPYILAPKSLSDELSESLACEGRWAFSSCATAEDVVDFMNYAVRVEDMPLGKWPSRFRPSFMQQAAISLILKARGASEVFSVNGPPGTGKTTLLKEIVAGTIVERAQVLARYAQPDDAFTKRLFNDGKGKKGGYSAYYPEYAVFENPDLMRFGMLVASANNKAVENITRELPGLDRMLDGVFGDDGMDEVRACFCPSDDALDFEDGEAGYFTELSDMLFDDEVRKSDDVARRVSWGLVSAPLGNRKNVGRFARLTLKPLLQRCTNELIGRRTEEGCWHNAVDRFQNQLKVVLALRDRLLTQSARIAEYLKLARDADTARIEVETARAEADERGPYLAERLAACEASLEESERSLEHAVASYRETEDMLEQAHEILRAAERDRDCEQRNYELSMSSRSWLKALFRVTTDEMRRARARLDESLERLDACRARKDALEDELKKKGAACAQAETLHACREEDREAVLLERKSLEQRVEQAAARSAWARHLEKRMRNRLKVTVGFPDGSVEEVDLWEFAHDLIGDDRERRARAHAASLWADEEFDREREKLLHCALGVQREFVLGSKCFRGNMHNLLMMWGYEDTQLENKGERQRADFSERDRIASYPHLVNSLFLFAPVLSTTFASVERLFGDVCEPGSLGMLIVDEAGQSSPQIALGALLRSTSAAVLGDPLQVEPVVTDEVDVIRRSIRDEDLIPYRAKSLSVQLCADYLNPWGTYLNGEWLGFPLTVHRRCISPMYEISNEISYGGTMNQQTKSPSQEKAEGFVFDRSYWLNVAGGERGNGDHYVEAQGEKALEFVARALDRGALEGDPRLFVIAPFKTVASGFKETLKKSSWYSSLDDSRRSIVDSWAKDGIGTVHVFQGKEADEVLFLLGCDRTAIGSVKWVDSHIVNVAVTRAKYRLCVIGDYRVWKENELFQKVKKHLDTYALRQLSELDREDEGFRTAADDLLESLPPSESFVIQEPGSFECEFVDDSFFKNVSALQLPSLTGDQLAFFRIDRQILSSLEEEVANNIDCGIRLYYFFRGLRGDDSRNMDASCCSILFCKAMERHLRLSLREKLAALFAAKGLENEKPALGAFTSVLGMEGNAAKLAARVDGCDEAWCKVYAQELNEFRLKRNACCHVDKFEWKDMGVMLSIVFRRKLLSNTTYIADHFNDTSQNRDPADAS